MTPAQARDMYRRQIDAHGQSVTFRRVNPAASVTVKARVLGYKPDELGGGILQGDRRIIVMAEDISFTDGLQPGDKAVVGGTLLNIIVVDDMTRRIGDTLIAYDLTARGG